MQNEVSRETFDYLTGRLKREHQEQFEERLLSDQDFSDAVAISEQEWLDAYATGKLKEEEAAALGPWMHSSARRRRRLEMARALLGTSRPSIRGRWAYLALAIAAGILLVASASFVWMRQQNSAPPLLVAANVPSVPTSPAVSGAHPDVILLVAERLRGGDQPVPDFGLHPGSPVRLQIVVPPAASTMTVTVRAEKGEPRVLVVKHGLKPARLAGQTYLVLELPAGKLLPGKYTAVVSTEWDTYVSQFDVHPF